MDSPSKPDIKPVPKPAPVSKPEDEDVKKAGDDQRRRLAAMKGRRNTVTSKQGARGATILG